MLASLLLLAAAVTAAGYHHYRRSGAAAIGFLLVLILASGACFAWLDGGAAMSFLALAAIVGALVLALDTEPQPGGTAAEVFPGDSDRGRSALRWTSVGALAGAAAWVHPAYLLLFAPILDLARRDRRSAPVWVVAGPVLPLLAALWSRSAGEGWRELPSPAHLLDAALTGWNLLFLTAGRNVGLVAWFLPVLMLVACYRRGSNRTWLLASVVAATVALVLVAPHNFWGGPGGGGNRWFLPLYGALWLLPVRVPGTRWLVVIAGLAAAFLWPAWAAPKAAAATPDLLARQSRSLARWLPYETTQRELPSSAEWQGTGVWSRSLGPGLRDGEEGPQLVPAEGPAELLIAAERPLESVLLDFGPRAGSDLTVRGGRTGDTLFRPDGGVRFEIELEGAARRHSMWWSDKPQHLYQLELRMPEGPERALPVAIMARPLDALPRSINP